MKRRKAVLKTVKAFEYFLEFEHFFYEWNGAKIYTIVANYVYYKFTKLERQNHLVIILYL